MTRGRLIIGAILIFLVIFIVFGILAWPKTSSVENLIAKVFYVCENEKTISASYYKGPAAPMPKPGEPPTPTGSVNIKLSDGRQMTLPQTISADGTRYANKNESFVFWGKGNGAFISENNNETYTGCLETTSVVSAKNFPEEVYPLYSGLSWGSEQETAFLGMAGYEVVSNPVKNISNLSAISVPFEKYYADKLKASGWTEDQTLAAGGPGSEITAYKKDGQYVILSFSTNFKGGGKNEPVQCPCDITFSVFYSSGGNIQPGASK